MQEHIGVVIILFDKEKQKMLIGKRKNAYRAGMYGLPGGRIMMKETVEEGAAREFYEETRLTAKKMTYLGVVRDMQETYTFIHFAFVCESYTGNIENAEPEKCEGWEWFSIDDIPEETLPGHLAAIDIFKNPEHSLRELL